MEKKYTFPPWNNIPEPYQDELLSSWLTRIAHSYHISLRELLSKHFSEYSLYYRDIDLTHLNMPIINKLSYLTQISTNQLYNMQVLTLEGVIQESIQVETRNKWVITSSGNTNLKIRQSMCLRICPLCLKEKSYYPKTSKLLFINACKKHHIQLIDSCQNCSSPILPMKTSAPKKIYQCFRCGYDLQKSMVTIACMEEINTTTFLLNSIQREFLLHKGKYISTLDYFTVLYLICKNLHRNFPKDQVFILNKKIKKLTKLKSPYLLYQPIPYLIQIISLAHHLLFEEWDEELLNFIKRNRLMYASQLLNKRENVNKNIPLWFFEHMQTLWIKRKKDQS
jgi:hypothetical protein